MNTLKSVTSNPHFREKDDTQRIMLYVIISLLPATVFGVYNFGINAAIVVAVSVIVAVLSELIYNKIVHNPKNTITDLSAVVTGLLIALNMPGGIAPWIPALGAIFGIIIVKMVFGGLGQNFMNPALGARCFLLISFAGPMTDFSNYKGFVDTFNSATPLALVKAGEAVDTMRMFIGTIPGTIGETSVICLVIGAMFLILLGVIDLRIPASYIISFVVFIVLFGGRGFDVDFIVAHICGGGLILGAFFMATDYVTSPITPNGKIVFGILCGILTGLFRIFGSGAEGVSYAIILSNICVPIIENKTIPLAFGIVKEKGGKK